MAISNSQASSSSTKPPPNWTHDVFLSFRGQDTRNSFTAHLYSALVQRGIKAYKDDKELKRGSTIEPELWKAIEESMFSIVIFSNDYCSSPWCLDELVKIAQCMRKGKQTVLPVFYDVDPSVVADQKGSYERAFSRYKQINKKKVKKWRDALRDVANLSGWDVQRRNEADIVREIVDRVWYDVSQTFSIASKDLVGIDSRIEVIKGFLVESSTEIRFIGVCGMGGVGKTTIARAVYDRIRWQFERCCFLANVRESFMSQRAISLQEQLLSQLMVRPSIDLQDVERGRTEIRRYLQGKKVLIIIDDVNDLEQLNTIAAEKSWFGPGSRVIITSRDKHLLSTYGVDGIYEVSMLNDEEALLLFSLKAFKQKQPQEGFVELSKFVVAHANGLPLALSVLGPHLHGRSVNEWKSAIERLNKVSNDKILDVLKISFDGLEDSEKQIFLDIACFFKGMDKNRVTNILDGCGFNACIGISVLSDKSLVSTSQENKLQMHDLLQRLGKKIIYCECPKEPGKRSRLWVPHDIHHVLENGNGKKVEAISLGLSGLANVRSNVDAFLIMRRLRLLRLFSGMVGQGPTYLSSELRYLEWAFYPLKSLPSTFEPYNLVEFHLSTSPIEKLWHESKVLPHLKILAIDWCHNLTESPNFDGIPNLEKLQLTYCQNLTKIHSSLQNLRKLIHLILKNCSSIREFPSSFLIKSLELIDLRYCSALTKFPTIRGIMPRLEELHLAYTMIENLPNSIECLTGLIFLDLSNCWNLQSLPRSILNLKALKVLRLCDCSKLDKLPKNLGQLKSLEELDLRDTAIRHLPKSAFDLKNLEILMFDGGELQPSRVTMPPSFSSMCFLQKLELAYCDLGEGSIPNDIGCLSKLTHLDLSGNNFVSLPRSISQLKKLERFYLNDCTKFISLPEIASNVQKVSMNGCDSLNETPDPMELCNPKSTEFHCLNCMKLYESNWGDQTTSIMIQRYLQDSSNPKPKFEIILPGKKIPKWFTYQSNQSPFVIPTGALNSREVMGLACCVVFRAKNNIICEFINMEISSSCNEFKTYARIFKTYKKAASDHFWSFYLSLKKLLTTPKVIGGLKVSFGSDHSETLVTNYGVRLVTCEEVEKLKDMTYLDPQIGSDDD